MRVYNNGDELLNEVKEKWNKNLHSMRVWGFVLAALMIVVGILAIVYPLQTTYFVEALASIALLVFGVWEVARYTQVPPFLRTGAGLASGVLNILLALMLLSAPAESMLATFGYLLGFDLQLLGFEQLTATSRLHSIGVTGTGWLTFDGVMSVIVGLMLVIMPMASVMAVSVILAVYLIVGGVSLLITMINAKDLEA